MKLILARHGNTFGPGDKITWVGSKNDLPLVKEGIAQAERFGAALAEEKGIEAIYCAPLLRTKTFAEMANKELVNAAPIIVDDRLTEIDYGQWNGRSDAEIADKFGQECLTNWIEKSIWPTNCEWAQSAKIVESEIKAFFHDVQAAHSANSTVVAVTSNGKMRYFLKLIESEFEKRVSERSFKVATGRVCLLDLNDEKIKLRLWNELPHALLTLSMP